MSVQAWEMQYLEEKVLPTMGCLGGVEEERREETTGAKLQFS